MGRVNRASMQDTEHELRGFAEDGEAYLRLGDLAAMFSSANPDRVVPLKHVIQQMKLAEAAILADHERMNGV